MAAELTLGLELETGGGASGGRRSGGGFVADGLQKTQAGCFKWRASG